MTDFAAEIQHLHISRERRKQADAPASPAEIKAIQSLAGKMNWLGHTAAPHYAFAASYLQQTLGDLRVRHLTQANGVLTEAKKNTPVLVFGRPETYPSAHISVFADAAFPKIDSGPYGQTGYICGIVLGEGPQAAFHPIAWTSHKQKRVCRSSSAAEILSIAEADDFGAAIKCAIHRIMDSPMPLHLNIDSRSLWDHMTTQHENQDFRLRQAVSILRESFERKDIDIMRWISGKSNPADALTKRNPSTGSLLNEMTSTGRLCVDYTLGSAATSVTEEHESTGSRS